MNCHRPVCSCRQKIQTAPSEIIAKYAYGSSPQNTNGVANRYEYCSGIPKRKNHHTARLSVSCVSSVVTVPRSFRAAIIHIKKNETQEAKKQILLVQPSSRNTRNNSILWSSIDRCTWIRRYPSLLQYSSCR